MPAGGLVRITVNEQDFASARQAIEKWEAIEPEPPPVSKKQPARHGLLKGLLLGLVLGVGGFYAAYKTPAAMDGTDYNRDGSLDDKWTFSLAGKPMKMEQDRNLDREIDFIADGWIESAKSDDDFNGTFETSTRYKNGNMVSEEVDTDGDGYPEIRRSFKNGILESVQYIKPTSGLPFRVEYFKFATSLLFADIYSDDDGTLDTRLTYSPLGDVVTRQAIVSSAAP